MDINLRIDGHHCNSVGFFNYKHYTDGKEDATIWLHSVICGVCNDHLLDAEDYCHVLEHELIELLSSRLLFLNEGITKWNGRGFNHVVAKAIPDGSAFHIHKEGISEVIYT